MKKTPLLILAFTRVEQLKQAVESAKQAFDVGKIYVYLDKFYDKETRDKQKDILIYLGNLKGVEWKVAPENLGCSKAMKSALEWFYSNEDFGVIVEEDIFIEKNAGIFLNETIEQNGIESPIIVRFGEYFWGWAMNKKAYVEIKAFDLMGIDDKDFIEKIAPSRMFRHINHFRMEKEAIRRVIGTAWDREYHIAINILKIPTFTPKKPLSLHNDGGKSARLERNKKVGSEFSGRIAMINGKIQ